MQRLEDMTIRDIGRSLARYQPFVITVLAIVLIAAFVPGEVEEETVDVSGPVTPQEQGPQPEGGPTGDVDDDGPAREAPAETVDTTPGGAPEEAGTVAAAEGDTAPAGEEEDPGPPPSAEWAGADPMDAPDCDSDTGRMMVPSSYVFWAPNCVPMWPDDADNHGNTYRGVTEDTITVTIYMAQEDEQQSAMVSAAGVEDTEEEERHEGRDKVVEAYEAHLETYGREVEWVEVQGSGPPDDDAAARSDAIKIAEEIGAFANISSPALSGGGNAFIDELAARGVLCIMCIPTQPHWNVQEWAPYVWNDRITGTGLFLHNAAHLGRRLGSGPPEYSPDPEFQLEEQRRFGLFLYNTEDGAYDGMGEFLKQELAQYGIQIAEVMEYQLDVSRSQEQARTMISRFADQGITSLICWCDPLTPVFFTQEATNQQYFPEWIITGSYLVDTALFGRTYDQLQWENAFGVSLLPARMDPDAEEEDPDIVTWHHGEEPETTPNQSAFGMLYTGVQLAGPNLNPETFRDGMSSLKPASGYLTRVATSYGEGQWPWFDYNAINDVTLIWWDPDEPGPDELGAYGRGLYRYVDMGERYLPGEWPDTPVPYFEEENTSTIYDERPERDRLPEYEPREPLREP